MKKNLNTKIPALLFAGVFAIFQAQSQSNVTTTTTGTSGQVPKFTSGTNIENSQITDDGTNVGVNDATPSYKLDVNGGDVNIQTSTGILRIGNNPMLWHNGNTQDIFVGYLAGNSTMTGHGNTALGKQALSQNTSGTNNTAIGLTALTNDTSGYDNTAVGHGSLGNNRSGYQNTACGKFSGFYCVTGLKNSILGYDAGHGNGLATSFSNNCIFGYQAGYSLSTGSNNIFMGYQSGYNNTTGNNNTIIGYAADLSTYNLTNATAIGYSAIVGASNSMVLGGTGSNAVSVGIGTTTPSSLFDIETSGSGSTGIDINNTASDGDPRVAFQLSGTSAFTIGVDDSDGDKFKIGTTAVETNTRMTIDGSGNVGIGLTAPGAKFEVAGTGSFLDPSGLKNTLQIGNDGTVSFISATAYAGGSYTPITFSSGSGGERMRITTAGNVGIGTTSPAGLLANTSTAFAGGGASDGLNWRSLQNDYTAVIVGAPSSGAGYGLRLHTNGATSSDFPFVVSSGTGSGTLRFVIRGDGRVGIGTTAPGGQFELSLDEGRKPSTNTWTIVSDARLKNIEGVYAKGLKEILLLNPISYYYKNVGERKFPEEVLSTLNVGFSAQEVQKIFPEAVGTDADGYLNFNMHSILVAYTNAFKEQQNMIEELKEEIKSIQTEMQRCCISNLSSQNNTNSTSSLLNGTTVNELELVNSAVLFQNYPNPFGEGTTIKYFVPDNSPAQIIFYDEFGSKLKEFAIKEKGIGQINLSTMHLAAGLYSYSLVVDGKVVDTKKMIRSK